MPTGYSKKKICNFVRDRLPAYSDSEKKPLCLFLHVSEYLEHVYSRYTAHTRRLTCEIYTLEAK